MSWILAFILGWIASFTASAIYSWGRRPSIEIRTERDSIPNIGQRPGHPRHRFFHLILENKEAPYPWRWFTQRDTAWVCEVSLNFYHGDRPNEKAILDTVIARWSSSPELLQPIVLPDASGQPLYRTIPDLTKLPYGRRMDLHAGRPEGVALVVKLEGQRQCYVFSNESYWLGWENESWRLEEGKYKIVAEVRSGRYKKAKAFCLVNQGAQLDSVTLRPWQHGSMLTARKCLGEAFGFLKRIFSLSIVTVTLIAALVAIFSTTINPWMNREPYQANLPLRKNMLEIFNPHGERIQIIEVNGHISKAVPYDTDGNGEKELFVAVGHGESASGEDVGKLLKYQQKVWPLGIRRLHQELVFDVNSVVKADTNAKVGIEDFDVRQLPGSEEPFIALVASQQGKWDSAYLFILDKAGKSIGQAYTHPGKLEFVRIALTRPTPVWQEPKEAPRVTIYVAGWGFDVMEPSSKAWRGSALFVSSAIPPGGEVVRSYYGLALLERRGAEVLPRWKILVYPKGVGIYGLEFYESDIDQTVEYITFWHGYDYQYNIRPELLRVWLDMDFRGQKPGVYPRRHEVCFELRNATWGHDPRGREPKWCDIQPPTGTRDR